MLPRMSFADRMKLFRVTLGSAPCWIWPGVPSPNGYVTIRHEGVGVYIHRLAYSLEKGAILLGYDIDHRCNNRNCFNPAHLRALTRRENLARGETIPTINSRKTHCPRGHELTEENLSPFFLKRGTRQCKICFADRERERRKRLKQRRQEGAP